MLDEPHATDVTSGRTEIAPVSHPIGLPRLLGDRVNGFDPATTDPNRAMPTNDLHSHLANARTEEFVRLARPHQRVRHHRRSWHVRLRQRDMSQEKRHHVVVVGGGFGGVQAALHLARLPVDVTLIDRRNFHLFQPLAYQVATGPLSPAEIAYPLRHIFRRHANVRVMLAEVTDVDLDARLVRLRDVAGGRSPEAVPYDTLMVSTGAQYNYFGHDRWRMPGPESEVAGRCSRGPGRILGAFEAAELEPDPRRRASWLTFVVVGAGPTGVEMAGQIAEIAHDVRGEFRSLGSRKAQILLVEAGDRIPQELPPSLSARAERSLASLGVTILTRHAFADIDAASVTLRDRNGDRHQVPARTVVWAAGVVASPLTRDRRSVPSGAGRQRVGARVGGQIRAEVLWVSARSWLP